MLRTALLALTRSHWRVSGDSTLSAAGDVTDSHKEPWDSKETKLE